jgi:LysR family transcriptional regulator (chromosome initiation inhibitor)
VSQRIKLLEERVGQVLVRRATPCTATEAGQALYRHAREIALSEADALAAIGGGRAAPRAWPSASMPTRWPPGSRRHGAGGEDPSITFDIHVEDQDHSANLLREARDGRRDGRPPAGAGLPGAAAGHPALPRAGQPGLHATLLCHGRDATTLARAPMLVFNRKDALQGRYVRRITRRASRRPCTGCPRHSLRQSHPRRPGLGHGPDLLVAGHL